MVTKATLRTRLTLENLEDRCTPAVITILGTAGNDIVSVNKLPNGLIQVVKNNVVTNYNPAVYTSVVFYGFAGDDRFINNTNLKSTAYGMEGHDTLIGGSNSDMLFGGLGRDYLNGRDGNDTLDGGVDGARDTLVGGLGADKFRREMVLLVNRDQPLDFSLAQGDTLY